MVKIYTMHTSRSLRLKNLKYFYWWLRLIRMDTVFMLIQDMVALTGYRVEDGQPNCYDCATQLLKTDIFEQTKRFRSSCSSFLRLENYQTRLVEPIHDSTRACEMDSSFSR